MDVERVTNVAAIEDTGRGQWLGVDIALAAIIASVMTILLDGPWQVAVALVGVPVLGAVQALIRGRESDKS